MFGITGQQPRVAHATRSVLSVALALMVIGALSACAGLKDRKQASTSATTAPSTQPQTDAQQTAPAADVKSNGSADKDQAQLAVQWRVDAGSQSRSSVTLEPAIDEDQVYTVGDEGQVYAYARSDGKRVWDRELDSEISAGIGASQGRLFVVTTEGKLIALSSSDGSTLWEQLLFTEVLATPRIESGVVVLRANDGKVLGINAATGERAWAYQRDEPALSLRGAASPLVHAGVSVTGFASGQLVANEVESGDILWELGIAEARGHNEIERLIDIDSEPVLNGSVLYVAVYNGQLTALALGSRRLLWQLPISSHRNIAVDTNHVYVTDVDNVLHAIDRLEGKSVWQQQAVSEATLIGPVLLDGELVVGDEEGVLHVLDAVTGQRLGQPTEVSSKALLRGMKVHDKTGFVLSRSGDLFAVKLNRTPATQ